MSIQNDHEVLSREQQRCKALLENDSAMLATLLSDQLSFMHANAIADDKPTLLAKMAKGNIVYHSISVTEENLIDLGKAAILKSKLTAQVSVSGQEKTIDNRTLSVWVKEGSKWLLLAYQPTPIPK